MLKQIREAAAVAASEIVKLLDQQAAEDLYHKDYISTDQLAKIMTDAGMPVSKVEYDGGFFVRYYYTMHPFASELIRKQVVGATVTNEQLKLIAIEMQSDRLKLAAWMALVSASNLSSSKGVVNIGQVSESREILGMSWFRNLQSMSEATVEQYLLRKCLKDVDSYIQDIIRKTNKLEATDTKLGLGLLFERKPEFTESEVLGQVYAAYRAIPTNALSSRTWGFELEIADAKGVDATFGIDKGQDGSLRSYEANDDCDCDCSDCTYHDCDCDWCDNRNTDPDHCNGSSCSSADMAEFRSVKGISRVKHAGLSKLCSNLNDVDAEVNDTCGVHIHVYAQDLTTKQVAHTLAIYKWLENMMAAIAGRDDTGYAKRIPTEYIKLAYSGKLQADKPRAINLTHIIGSDFNYQRGTAEFRQMAGNYDFELITVWAWTLRGLIEVAKRGAQLKDFLAVKSFNDLIEVYGKFNFLLHDEHPDLLIPGGQQDSKHIKRYAHERA